MNAGVRIGLTRQYEIMHSLPGCHAQGNKAPSKHCRLELLPVLCGSRCIPSLLSTRSALRIEVLVLRNEVLRLYDGNPSQSANVEATKKDEKSSTEQGNLSKCFTLFTDPRESGSSEPSCCQCYRPEWGALLETQKLCSWDTSIIKAIKCTHY